MCIIHLQSWYVECSFLYSRKELDKYTIYVIPLSIIISEYVLLFQYNCNSTDHLYKISGATITLWNDLSCEISIQWQHLARYVIIFKMPSFPSASKVLHAPNYIWHSCNSKTFNNIFFYPGGMWIGQNLSSTRKIGYCCLFVLEKILKLQPRCLSLTQKLEVQTQKHLYDNVI